jgi:hypothetical protein
MEYRVRGVFLALWFFLPSGFSNPLTGFLFPPLCFPFVEEKPRLLRKSFVIPVHAMGYDL